MSIFTNIHSKLQLVGPEEILIGQRPSLYEPYVKFQADLQLSKLKAM
jgi:hypothetical protein